MIGMPRNESLIQQNMAELNGGEAAPQALSVTVSVPKSSSDSVVIREAATRTRVCSIRQEEEEYLKLDPSLSF